MDPSLASRPGRCTVRNSPNKPAFYWIAGDRAF